MGSFSVLIHESREYQFKTGWDDNLPVYRVGDRIDWKPDPQYPGEHIDGVHDALSGYRPGDPEVWVVIKDCVIVAVEPRQRQRQDLEFEYGVGHPDPRLWTPEQWKAKADREAEAEACYQAWAAIHGDNPGGYYMHCRMSEKSFVEQILPLVKVTND
jgi:hypothetical protein